SDVVCRGTFPPAGNRWWSISWGPSCGLSLRSSGADPPFPGAGPRSWVGVAPITRQSLKKSAVYLHVRVERTAAGEDVKSCRKGDGGPGMRPARRRLGRARTVNWQNLFLGRYNFVADIVSGVGVTFTKPRGAILVRRRSTGSVAARARYPCLFPGRGGPWRPVAQIRPARTA